MYYAIIFTITAGVVLLLTFATKVFAKHFGIVDNPDLQRKIHLSPTPLLGGIPIFLGFSAVLLIIYFYSQYFVDSSIQPKHIVGLLLGGVLLSVGGYLDDRYDLGPGKQIFFTILATLVVIIFGIGIREITNPFGGIISLVWWEKVLFWWNGVGYRVTLPADLFSFVWLMIIIYTTKFLDGLDGLVSGITVIGVFIIFFLAILTKFFQPDVGILSIIVAGAFFGFLVWNWYPAKIFLGTGGSTFAGFILGVLAIISGGKIATTLLILGLPILDMFWVVFRRLIWEKKKPTIADGKHLHFRLLDAGFSHKKAVMFLYVLSAMFGLSTIFLQSKFKLITLGVLGIFMIALAVWVVRRYKGVNL